MTQPAKVDTMGYLDELKKKYESEPKTVPLEKILRKEGYIWVNMLIRYDLTGKAEIVRVFSQPAKQSMIKTVKKEKKTSKVIKIEKPEETKSLF